MAEQALYRFASRAALLSSCPPRWIIDGAVRPPVAEASFIELGTLWDAAAVTLDREGQVVGKIKPREGYFALIVVYGEEPQGLSHAKVQWMPGDPSIPGEIAPPPPPEVMPVPESITRAQARIAMSQFILADGGSLLSHVRDLLQQGLSATEPLGDAAPERMRAVQASEWWSSASVYSRSHPVLVQLGALLGLDDGTIDNLFRQAGSIAE